MVGLLTPFNEGAISNAEYNMRGKKRNVTRRTIIQDKVLAGERHYEDTMSAPLELLVYHASHKDFLSARLFGLYNPPHGALV